MKGRLEEIKDGVIFFWNPCILVNKRIDQLKNSTGVPVNDLDNIWDSFEIERLEEMLINHEKNKKRIKWKDIKGIDVKKINLVLLDWVHEKWLQGCDDENQKKEKENFYQWLRSNYLEHLIGHSKNKDKHFQYNSAKLKYESLISGGMTVWKMVSQIVSLIAATVLGRRIDKGVRIFVQKILNQENVKTYSNIFFTFIVIGIIFIIINMLSYYFFSKKYYVENRIKLEKNDETWIRHQRAVMEYQTQMMNYIYDQDGYRYLNSKEEKDQLFIANIIKIWKENGKRFVENMKKEQ